MAGPGAGETGAADARPDVDDVADAGGGASKAAPGAGEVGMAGAELTVSGDSSKARPAKAITASTASDACGPEARTSSSWPARAPSVATRDKLDAGTHAEPVVLLRTSTFAS